MRGCRISVQKQIVVDEPTVNLTPLIDVVFVILIMFIVIAPLLELDRVELAAASNAQMSKSQSTQESSPIAVHVHQDNTIWMNQQLIHPGELSAQIRQTKKNFPNARLQVFHDKRAHFGIYQSVKNAAEEAGFSEMDIILKPA